MHTVHIDLINPDSAKTKKNFQDGTMVQQEYTFAPMTFLDPATGWFEMVEDPHYIIKYF